MTKAPTLEDVRKARDRIAVFSHHTPLVPSFALSRMAECEVRLKLECFQDTRAFKVRGAANAILEKLEGNDPPQHLVTYSTGNHGRATAYVGSKLGLPTTVCMSTKTTEAKRTALSEFGADLEIFGDSQDEAQTRATQLAASGMTLIDPINDPSVTAGHGTLAMELVEDWTALDTVVVPVSGGALISGIAIALDSLSPSTRVVGVSMDRGAAMYESLRAGRPVLVDEVESLADCLQGGISLDNNHTFATVRDLVDDLVLVSEEQIATAMAEAFHEEGLILEGAGAAAIAAVLYGERSLFGENIALIASGGNVATEEVYEVAQRNRKTLVEALAR